jgi:hypothetical protein
MDGSRRRFLKLGSASAVALTTSVAGCSAVQKAIFGGNGDLRMVPDGVSFAGRVDVADALDDAATTQVVDAVLGVAAERESYEGPANESAARERVRSTYGLDPENADTAVSFGTYPSAERDERYDAVWFDAEWSEEGVREAVERSDVDLTAGTYGDKTVYEPTDDARDVRLGVLDTGTYVIGTESAVTDAIDVATGESDPVGDEFTGAYDAVRSAPVRFVSTVPADRLPSTTFETGGSTIDPQRLVPVDHVAGVTYQEDSSVALTLKLMTGSASDATDVQQALSGAISALETELSEGPLRSALDSLSVTSDGSTVVVEGTQSVEQATELVAAVARPFVDRTVGE